MAWTDTGTVNITRTGGPSLHRVRFQWESVATIAVLNMREPLVGVLDHIRCIATGGGGQYTVRLYSEYDVDVLNGRGVDLVEPASTDPIMIRKLLDGADLPRPIAVMGFHVFRAAGVNVAGGVFDLYYWPDLAMALEHRAMH